MARTRRRKLNPGLPLAVACSPALLLRMLAKTAVVLRGRWECWEWQGHRDDNGYGQVKVAGKAMWVHRVGYAAFRGPIPAGDEVDHRCRNPSCWRPHHLRRRDAAAHAAESARRPRRPLDEDAPF